MEELLTHSVELSRELVFSQFKPLLD